MNMTPNERAEQEARKIVVDWCVSHGRLPLISAITAALLPKYELAEACECVQKFKLDPKRFSNWQNFCISMAGTGVFYSVDLSLGDLRRISSTLQKIGGGR